MADDRLKNERLAAIFITGLVLFSYPLLSLFNLGVRLLGIPLLYIYLFSAWLAIIVLTALTTMAGRRT
jgi:hypothetical protein